MHVTASRQTSEAYIGSWSRCDYFYISFLIYSCVNMKVKDSLQYKSVSLSDQLASAENHNLTFDVGIKINKIDKKLI